MRTTIFLLALIFTAAWSLAQTPPPGTISHPPSGSRAVANTNAPSGTYSLEQLGTQLHDLHRSVNETLPMLNTVTAGESNAPAGGLAGVIGGLLGRETNQTGSSTGGSTNVLSSILRGVMGTNADHTASISATTFSDLTTLRDQLQAIAPILDRLDVPQTGRPLAGAAEAANTNSLTPTGRQ